MQSKRQLQDLIESLIEEDITPEEHAALSEMLKSDPEARRLYTQHVKLHNMMQWEFKRVEDTPGDHPAVAPLPRSMTPLILRVAAAVVFFILSYALLVDRQPQPGGELVGGEQEAAVLVARLTSLHDAAGLQTPNDAKLGDWLAAGTVRLDSGLVEVTFDSGASVVLEGPAEFRLESSKRGFLASGKLVAQVPGPAAGFIVNTPTANVVDLGTSFALDVSQSKGTEVHVLEGVVEVSSNDSQAATKRTLRAREAVVVAGALRPIAFAPDSFTSAPGGDSYSPAYNYVHYSFDEGDGTAVGDSHDGSFSGDFRSAGQDTSSPWVPGVFGEALRFDGQDDYVRTAFPGISGNLPRTIAFWVKVPPQSTHEDAYAILSWGKKVARGQKWVVQWNTKPNQGVVGATRVSIEGGHFVGTTDLRDGLWHHVAIVYIGGESANVASHVRLYVDGVFDGISGASASVEIDTETLGEDAMPMRIGRYMQKNLFFSGSLDELYVFDAALTPAAIMQLKTSNKPPGPGVRP
jgi:ferric-dicitrate binding protein FerR (iron transport regulator)